MTMVLKWFRPADPVVLGWIGPTASILAEAQRDPTAVAAIAGPPGSAGPAGPAGPGIADYDPGDLNVWFENALI